MNYQVAIAEIVEYLVPITARNEMDADRAAMQKFLRTSFEGRVRWRVAVRACEVDGVNSDDAPRVSSSRKMKRGALRHSADL